ncbi:hypothetical protein LINPERPRIM_LOCUS2352, partial [Linum perenne]
MDRQGEFVVLSLWLCRTRERFDWEVPVRFNLRGGAREELRQLLQMLSRVTRGRITAGPPDIVWSLTSNHSFSVQSL